MTVTAVSASYRVRIATRGASQVSGNVALTLLAQESSPGAADADISAVPILSGPSVDVLGGKSTSHPFDLEVQADSVLFLDGGRLATIGRLIDVQRSDDGGAFATLATGRISGASEVNEKGKITLEVSDEGWAERDTEIFATTDTIQLHPPGLASAWMTYAAEDSGVYEVMEVDGDAVRIRTEAIGNADALKPIPASLREHVALDLVGSADRDDSATNTAGNFQTLRFEHISDDGAGSNVVPGDFNVLSFRENLGGTLLVGTGVASILSHVSPEGSGVLRQGWIYFGGAHGLQVGDLVTGRYYFPSGLPVSENVPLHIGGTDGIHPGTLLEEIVDGTHGGNAVNFDAAAMTAFQALSLPKVWVRITKPPDRRNWLAKNFWPVFNAMPLVGTDLQIRPQPFRLDQDVDPDTLTTVSAADGDTRIWEHGSRDLVTALELVTTAVRKRDDTTDRGEDWPTDSLESFGRRRSPNPIIEHDNVATLGRIVRTIETDLIFLPSAADDTAEVLAQDIFDVFGDGPVRGAFEVPDSSTIEVGDLVKLDQTTLKGFNPGTGGRTGERIVRPIEFRERTPATITFGYLDLGPASVPLTAPTVSIIQNVTDPDLVDVTISGLGAGETATVEVGVAAVEPTDFDFRRSGVGNETISFRVEAGSDTAWVRAFAFAPHRIRSPYASDSVALSARATITDATVALIGFTFAEVRWDVPSTTGGIQSDYAIHDRNADPVWGSNITDHDATTGGFNISGMQSSRQMVSVRLTPYPGWDGNNVTGTAGTQITVESIFRRVTGGITIRRAELTSIETTFDGSGNAIVSVRGDEEAAVVYVTVGDGTEPADPTAAANDGSVADRTGRITTAVTVTAGNDAFVKAVSADADGVLGPVSLSQAARPVTTGGAGSGLALTAGALALDIEDLTLVAGSAVTALDSLPFHDDGVGSRRVLMQNVPISVFNNDAGYAAGFDTAGDGLVAVGSTLSADYDSTSNLISDAGDGTGITVDGANDRTLVYDVSEAGTPKVKFINVDQLPFGAGDITRVNITAGDGLSGSVDTTSGDHTQTLDWSPVGLTLDGGGGMGGLDSLPWHDDGVGPKRTLFQNVPLSIFNNDAGFTAGALETASTGLTTVGSDVQVQYAGGAGSLIGAASALVGEAATADAILLGDGGVSGDVKSVLLGDINVSLFDNDAGYGTGTVTSVGTGTGLTGGPITGSGTIDLNFNALSDRTLAGGDKVVFYSPGGAGHFTDIVSGIPLSIFSNDAGWTSNIGDITGVTAGNGLTGGGSSGGVTLDVGSGDGISVAANSVAVDSTVVRTSGAQTIGGVKTFSSRAIFQGEAYAEEGAEVTRGTAGAVTLDWDSYQQVDLRNDGNIDTINIDDGSMNDGGHYTLVIRAATGVQSSITFSAVGTLNWQFGTAPTLPTTVGDRTVITFVKSGGITLGFYADAPT